MGRGKFKNKPTGKRQFSTPEEMLASTSTRPRTFRRQEVEHEVEDLKTNLEKDLKKVLKKDLKKVLKKNLTNLKERMKEQLEKQKAHERYMNLQEQGKTEPARKDLERLSLIRQQRAEAAKKREEEKAAKEPKKAEARK